MSLLKPPARSVDRIDHGRKARDEGRDVLLFVDNIYRYTPPVLRCPRYWPYAFSGRLPAHIGGDGCSAGAHHNHQDWLNHFGSGGIRTSRRLN